VLAWMDTFDPNAAGYDSPSESGDGDTKAVYDIQLDKSSIGHLDRFISDTSQAITKIAEFRAALPSIQVAYTVHPQSQKPQMQQPAVSFQPHAPSLYSNISSSSYISKPASSHDGPRKMGVRSAAVTQKYFTHLGNLDYRCNTCGATVRDGTRDYHLKRYHLELVQRLHEEISNLSANPENDGEKKVSILSVTYDNMGDLNFRCKLCGKIVRDGSRDYHIKQHHSDRIEELKEQKRHLIAERHASESARRFSQMSSPATPMPTVHVQDVGPQVGAAFSPAVNIRLADGKPMSPKSHKKKEPPSEPSQPKALSRWQIEEMKKKGVSLRENEKLRNLLIDEVSTFIDLDICQAFREADGRNYK
jgi:hypothetical protein